MGVTTEGGPESFLNKIDQAVSLRECFEYGLAAMLSHLNPERALAAYRASGEDELVAQATHGFDPQTVFVAGEISTELIKTVLRDGQGMCLVDAHDHPGLSNRTSVILSGLRSIVCVPILHLSGLTMGLLYADNRIRAGAFDTHHQSWLEGLSSKIAERVVHLSRAHESQAEATATAPQQAGDAEAWRELRQQALALFREKKLSEATETLARSVEHARGLVPLDARLGQTLGELAEMQRQSGLVQEAERTFIEAIDCLERLGPALRKVLAPVLTNLATLYFSNGNGIRAEGLYLRALEIWKTEIGAEDRRLAPLYYNLATLRRAAGAAEEAQGLFQVALRIAEAAWGPEHPHSQRCRAALEA